MDEAMHPLTILAVGLYGKTLMNQNGAPIRLVVPWKYGFKGIKSIVRISFVDKEPAPPGTIANPSEYGFYSNVNPEVDHPRWSQATGAAHRRVREPTRRRCSTATATRWQHVRRHGSAEESTDPLRAAPLGASPAFVAALFPAAYLTSGLFNELLGANPAEALQTRRASGRCGSWS